MLMEALAQYLGNGSALPLPLRERVGERWRRASNDFIFINQTLKPRGDRLIPPDKGPLLFQLLLQLFDRDIARHRIAIKRQCRGGSRGSPIAKHAPETRAADWPSWVIEAQRPAT